MNCPGHFLHTLPLLLILTATQTLSQNTRVDPVAPTHGIKSAQEIDHEWQASVAKYDSVRAAKLREVDQQANRGPYRPDWETLRMYQIPQWYKDAKFGIFIHWGVFSVPGAVNEWYPRNMYQKSDPAFQEHLKRYGPQDKVRLQRAGAEVQSREMGSGRLGAPLQTGWCSIRRSRIRASRRVRALQL